MKNSKKVLSACLAAVSVLSVAASVFAADYVADPAHPGYGSFARPGSTGASPAPAVPEVSTGSDGSAVLGTAATTETISNAINQAVEGNDSGSATVNLKSSSNLVISASTIKELASSGSDLKLVGRNVTMEIKGDNIANASKLNLSYKTLNDRNSTKLVFKSKKDFGCEIKLTLKGCQMSKAKLKNAKVYCNGKLVGDVELDENGKPVITVTSGGVYEIRLK